MYLNIIRLLLPFKYLINCDTLYFGGILTIPFYNFHTFVITQLPQYLSNTFLGLNESLIFAIQLSSLVLCNRLEQSYCTPSRKAFFLKRTFPATALPCFATAHRHSSKNSSFLQALTFCLTQNFFGFSHENAMATKGSPGRARLICLQYPDIRLP